MCEERAWKKGLLCLISLKVRPYYGGAIKVKGLEAAIASLKKALAAYSDSEENV
jgi:hypothetical protein